jgi:transcriptional regulator with XRE-family HTH domain
MIRAMSEPDPTVRERQLGAQLRGLREGRSWSLAEVARRLCMSVSKLSRMENGHRGVRLVDLAAMLAIYEVTGTHREELLDLCTGSDQRGWWQQFGSRLSVQLQTLIPLEADATRIVNFETIFVPGLLQSGEYTRAVMRDVGMITDEVIIEERMVARLARQAVLRGQSPPEFLAIIDEPALHRLIGGRDVMRRQLEHLVELSGWWNIDIRVVPMTVSAHPGLNGPFVLYRFVGKPTVINLENRTSRLFLEEPDEIKIYGAVVSRLVEVALDSQGSIELIAALARRLE